jgi:hypothetical protein
MTFIMSLVFLIPKYERQWLYLYVRMAGSLLYMIMIYTFVRVVVCLAQWVRAYCLCCRVCCARGLHVLWWSRSCVYVTPIVFVDLSGSGYTGQLHFGTLQSFQSVLVCQHVLVWSRHGDSSGLLEYSSFVYTPVFSVDSGFRLKNLDRTYHVCTRPGIYDWKFCFGNEVSSVVNARYPDFVCVYDIYTQVNRKRIFQLHQISDELYSAVFIRRWTCNECVPHSSHIGIVSTPSWTCSVGCS